MTIRRLILGLGATLLVSVTGCVPLGALVLEAEDDGSAVTIQVGERIIVKLASNPSTGYAWEAYRAGRNRPITATPGQRLCFVITLVGRNIPDLCF